jgi:hypothetical protein
MTITTAATSTAPCADDDAQIIVLAKLVGYMVSGCVSVQPFCEHAAYSSIVQATCPATCGSCTAPDRRLADGKDPNADEFDWIDELTVVAPAADVKQRTEEFNTDVFYP